MDKIGYSFSLKVHSFQEKKSVLWDAIRAGVARCHSCDKPAAHIFWNDQEEWYLECHDHYDPRDQFGGSTRAGYPRILSFPVISGEAAEAWMKSEPFGKGRKYKIQQYDRTDYYALMFEDSRKNEHLISDATKDKGWCVKVYPLTDGRFVYEIEYRHYSSHGGFGQSYGVIGAFDTEQAALEAAMKDENMPDYLKPKEGTG